MFSDQFVGHVTEQLVKCRIAHDDNPICSPDETNPLHHICQDFTTDEQISHSPAFSH